MENKELSQQGLDGESMRLEYKSPTLRKLGQLTDMTLAGGHTSSVADGQGMQKTS